MNQFGVISPVSGEFVFCSELKTPNSELRLMEGLLG
jgi:hypothetical protein